MLIKSLIKTAAATILVAVAAMSSAAHAEGGLTAANLRAMSPNMKFNGVWERDGGYGPTQIEIVPRGDGFILKVLQGPCKGKKMTATYKMYFYPDQGASTDGKLVFTADIDGKTRTDTYKPDGDLFMVDYTLGGVAGKIINIKPGGIDDPNAFCTRG